MEHALDPSFCPYAHNEKTSDSTRRVWVDHEALIRPIILGLRGNDAAGAVFDVLQQESVISQV